MKDVTVDKNVLLATLQNNRKQHADEFKKIMESYMETLTVKFEEGYDLLSKGEIPDLDMPSIPESHTSDYDRAIKMVEMEVNDHFILEDHDFRQLVMDEWSWKHIFEMTKSAYGVR